MKTDKQYFNRELSWLSFNYRVLQESKDKSVPLYERIKFLAIYSSNLDEFFRIRVASLRSLLLLKKSAKKDLDFNPQILLDEIKSTVFQHQEEFGKIFRDEIIPELNKHNIFLVNEKHFPKDSYNYLKEYFYNQLFPLIHPTLLDKSRISTFLHNRAIYFAVKLSIKTKAGKKSSNKRFKYAIVEIPSTGSGRFVKLPSSDENNNVMFIDDIIRLFLPEIFPGYEIDSCYSIKLTRDAEMYIDDEFSGNLLEKIKKGLSKRKLGLPSRFLYDKEIPKDFLEFLKNALKLTKDDLIAGGKYHNFFDFFSFPNFEFKELEYPPMLPLNSKDIDAYDSIFDAVTKKDILLSFPYQSFNYVLKFLDEAATDINVKSISITLYRVANESLVVRALVKAAKSGKKVTAFVEVKARFDEESNFLSADVLQKAGVNVIFSFPGLKVHSKLCLIEKTEKNKVVFYSCLATGNFNEKTARVYADFTLLTKNQKMGKEIYKVFNFLITKYEPKSIKNLIIAPFNIRQSFYNLIEKEIEFAKNGNKGSITIKLNSLEDDKIINRLYEASKYGVKINIIVRGICCIIPGQQQLSENMQVISIVDRFLEHSRIFIFNNGGDKKYFLSSADLMKRNLNRRIEACFPIYDKSIQSLLEVAVDIQLKDNTKARRINSEQNNKFVQNDAEDIRSQYAFYDILKRLNSN